MTLDDQELEALMRSEPQHPSRKVGADEVVHFLQDRAHTSKLAAYVIDALMRNAASPPDLLLAGCQLGIPAEAMREAVLVARACHE